MPELWMTWLERDMGLAGYNNPKFPQWGRCHPEVAFEYCKFQNINKQKCFAYLMKSKQNVKKIFVFQYDNGIFIEYDCYFIRHLTPLCQCYIAAPCASKMSLMRRTSILLSGCGMWCVVPGPVNYLTTGGRTRRTRKTTRTYIMGSNPISRWIRIFGKDKY